MITQASRGRYLEKIPYDFSIVHRVNTDGHDGILHIHDVFELLLVLSDNVMVYIDEEQFPVPRDSLLMFSNSNLHCTMAQPGPIYDRYVLYLCPEQIDIFSTEQVHLMECFYRHNRNESHILPLDDTQLDVILPLFAQLHYMDEHPLPGDDLLRQMILCQILIYTNRYYGARNNVPTLNANRNTRLIYSVVQYINDHYDQPLTLTDLAKVAYLSEPYLCRLFKELIGTPPMEYVSNLRISKAKEVLIRGVSVSEACILVGYPNLSNFSRQFKNRIGISPREYVAQNRRK